MLGACILPPHRPTLTAVLDDSRSPTKTAGRERLAGHRRGQRLPHRAPMNTVAPRQRADRQPLAVAVAPDLVEELHRGTHPFRDLPLGLRRARTVRSPSDGVGPVQAVTVGPVQTVAPRLGPTRTCWSRVPEPRSSPLPPVSSTRSNTRWRDARRHDVRGINRPTRPAAKLEEPVRARRAPRRAPARARHRPGCRPATDP